MDHWGTADLWPQTRQALVAALSVLDTQAYAQARLEARLRGLWGRAEADPGWQAEAFMASALAVGLLGGGSLRQTWENRRLEFEGRGVDWERVGPLCREALAGALEDCVSLGHFRSPIPGSREAASREGRWMSEDWMAAGLWLIGPGAAEWGEDAAGSARMRRAWLAAWRASESARLGGASTPTIDARGPEEARHYGDRTKPLAASAHEIARRGGLGIAAFGALLESLEIEEGMGVAADASGRKGPRI